MIRRHWTFQTTLFALVSRYLLCIFFISHGIFPIEDLAQSLIHATRIGWNGWIEFGRIAVVDCCCCSCRRERRHFRGCNYIFVGRWSAVVWIACVVRVIGAAATLPDYFATALSTFSTTTTVAIVVFAILMRSHEAFVASTETFGMRGG